MSLCHAHGQHVLLRTEAAKHPRHQEPARDTAFERELVKAIAPVVINRWNTVTDPQSSAEAVFQHIQELMRRLD